MFLVYTRKGATYKIMFVPVDKNTAEKIFKRFNMPHETTQDDSDWLLRKANKGKSAQRRSTLMNINSLVQDQLDFDNPIIFIALEIDCIEQKYHHV